MAKTSTSRASRGRGASRAPRMPRKTPEQIQEERDHCAAKSEHLLGLLLDETKVYKYQDRDNMMCRLHNYILRLVKLPVSELRAEHEGQTELCERYEIFLADELNDQRNGARVLGRWLAQYRKMMAAHLPKGGQNQGVKAVKPVAVAAPPPAAAAAPANGVQRPTTLQTN